VLLFWSRRRQTYKLTPVRIYICFDFEKFLKSAESITLDLFNSTIGCEILRISEQNSDYSKFVSLSENVLRQVANQGSTLISIKRSLERISSSTTYFEQYHKDSQVIISDLF